MLHGDAASCQQDVCVRGERSNASGVSVVSFHQGVYSVLLAMCLQAQSARYIYMQCHIGRVFDILPAWYMCVHV